MTRGLKQRVWQAIDRRSDEIVGLGEAIRRNPELGFKEVGAEHYREIGHRTGSTDMGDLSQVMPIVHPYMGGASGTGHAADYEIVDQALAYVGPAKALAGMVIDMLADGARGAREVIAASKPRMTREEYLAFQRGIWNREVWAEGARADEDRHGSAGAVPSVGGSGGHFGAPS